MKKTVILVIVFLMSFLRVLCYAEKADVSSPQNQNCDIGETVVFTSSCENADSSVWFCEDKNGLLTEINPSKTSTKNKVLTSELKVKTSGNENENKYFCLFISEKNTIISDTARVIFNPKVVRNDDKTDSNSPQDSLCAILCADAFGVGSDFESNWYRISDSGEYLPLVGDKYFVNDNYLIISDLDDTDDGYYIRRVISNGIVAESSKIKVRLANDETLNPIVTLPKLTDLFTPIIGKKAPTPKSAESVKYSVLSFDWGDSVDNNGVIVSNNPTLTLTLKAKEGFSFQYTNGKIHAVCGDITLNAEKNNLPSFITDTITLSVSFEIEKEKEISPISFPQKYSLYGSKLSFKFDNPFSGTIKVYGNNATVDYDNNIVFNGNIPKSVFVVLSNSVTSTYSVVKLKTESKSTEGTTKVNETTTADVTTKADETTSTESTKIDEHSEKTTSVTELVTDEKETKKIVIDENSSGSPDLMIIFLLIIICISLLAAIISIILSKKAK